MGNPIGDPDPNRGRDLEPPERAQDTMHPEVASLLGVVVATFALLKWEHAPDPPKRLIDRRNDDFFRYNRFVDLPTGRVYRNAKGEVAIFARISS